MISSPRKTNVFILGFIDMRVAIAVALLPFVGCGGPRQESDADRIRAQFCKPVSVIHDFEETPYYGGTANILSFQGIRARVNAACAACHQAPAKTGGFTYIDSWQGQQTTINGAAGFYPGFTEVAEKMRDYILHDDPAKRMPPAERRGSNPDAFFDIGHQLNYWIMAGKPSGTFEAGKLPEDRRGKFRPVLPKATSDLGDCIPTAKAVGYDYKADRFFQTTKELPKFLVDTDLFTLDPYLLAQSGTLAYNVEYPLWADNAEKGRWIHVPMKEEGGELKKQSIVYDPSSKSFQIPENTRFYKNFYKAVKLPNGKTRMRRVETRLIVSRTPYTEALFGTYQWDEKEQVATLVEAPYRDGTPWKDQIFEVVSDEVTQKTRTYLIPGRARCVDCHMGSPMKNFVLGFQPLQIHRRAFGEAGRVDPVGGDELTQVDRFLSYGLLTGLASERDLPGLETSAFAPYRNVYELQANGYAVGNCFHCHNPNGLAFTKENGIRLGLGPGELASFSTNQTSVEIPNKKLAHPHGELDSSQIWHKIFDPPQAQGIFSQMPMHTPGAPDCRVLSVIGRWIRSYESLQAAADFIPPCKKENSFTPVDMDFTWPTAAGYVPRRADWKDPVDGMPPLYRALDFTSALQQATQKQYPVGYWSKKQNCKFPDKDIPPEERLPWMMNGDKPKRPFGEVYYTAPGAYFFRNTCMKCHGPNADGESSLARGILNWSGGAVHVANLRDGLFGEKTANFSTFDLDGKNYAGQYMIWMAMEGTRVTFPKEASDFVGKHGAQMLRGIRDRCLAQISTDKPSSPRFVDHYLYSQVCFTENLSKTDPSLQYDPRTNRPLNPDAVDAWADRAARNAGWAIFDFLRQASVGGTMPPTSDQCELVYGNGGN